MNSLNVKNTFLLNSSFEWIFSLHSLIFVSTDSIICDEAIIAWSHSKRKNIVKMTIVIHDCECFFSCEKSCVFHAKHACSRIINREIDHFDRFKIEIKFFVRFFLKFIENDCFSWMRNAVNNDWWMRKWVVNKMKMKRWIILDLKDCFFYVFV
jgi:superfamily II helicase